MKWLKHYFKQKPVVADNIAVTEADDKSSDSRILPESTTTLKTILILAIVGTSILVLIASVLVQSPKTGVKESSMKDRLIKDWLPPQQQHTEGAVLEKTLKDLKAQGSALMQLEKRLREESLSSEVRWQQLEETLSELKAQPVVTTPTAMQVPETPAPQVLRHDTFNLSLPETPPVKKTAANYVPAGSFVKAVLLSGLDVSAGVSASLEPRPVLMRVIDNGSLPNQLKSQLTDCRLIGAAVGDVSSERAYIRLERLSCLHRDEFTDFPVFGYVSGTDGKAGIRGRVVMKDAAVVSRAFLSGFLGGLSDGAGNGLTQSSVSALGQVNTIGAQDVLKYGSFQGASNAMELYADYLIKRAEQYQPVIEVSAGTPVDVVFHQGFYLEGLREKDAALIKPSKTIPTFYEPTSVDEDN